MDPWTTAQRAGGDGVVGLRRSGPVAVVLRVAGVLATTPPTSRRRPGPLKSVAIDNIITLDRRPESDDKKEILISCFKPDM